MKINSVVILVFIFGSIMVTLTTLLRYLIPRNESASRKNRLLHAFKIIDIRYKTPDAGIMLTQYTGILWLLLGILYGILTNRFVIKGLMGDILELLVLLGPEILLIVTIIVLKQVIWR